MGTAKAGCCMNEQRIPPLILFTFYSPFKLEQKKKFGMYEAHLGLNAFEVIHSFLFTFKQPKRRIKMAAQSCTCSTDANAEKELNF